MVDKETKDPETKDPETKAPESKEPEAKEQNFVTVEAFEKLQNVVNNISTELANHIKSDNERFDHDDNNHDDVVESDDEIERMMDNGY